MAHSRARLIRDLAEIEVLRKNAQAYPFYGYTVSPDFLHGLAGAVRVKSAAPGGCGCKGRRERDRALAVAAQLDNLSVRAKAEGFTPPAGSTEGGTGTFGVNLAMIWALVAGSIYGSTDKVMVSVREALQNSRDAGATEFRVTTLRDEAHKGVVSEAFGGQTYTMIIEDNGKGMSHKVVTEKFMSLGDTTKVQEALQSGDAGAVGGFGLAKAAILAGSINRSFALHTGNRVYFSDAQASEGYRWVTVDESYQGVKITLYNVPLDQKGSIPGLGEQHTGEERITTLFRLSYLPKVRLILNGQTVLPAFADQGARTVPKGGDGWSSTLKVRVRSYPAKENQGIGFVRIGGIMHFAFPRSYSDKGFVKHVVIEILGINAAPQDPNYPLSADRAGFRHYKDQYRFQDIVSEFRKKERAEEVDEYQTYSAAGDRFEGEAAKYGHSVLAAFTESASVAAAIQQATKDLRALGTKAFLDKMRKNDAAAIVAQTPDAGAMLAYESVAGKTPETPEEWSEQVKKIRDRFGLDKKSGGYHATQEAAGWSGDQTVSSRQINAMTDLIDLVLRRNIVPTGGNRFDLLLTLMAKAEQGLALADDEHRARAQQAYAAMLGKVYTVTVHKDYNAASAGQFRRNLAKHFPALLLWQTACVSVAKLGGSDVVSGFGFILESDVYGMWSRDPDSGFVHLLINPDFFYATVTAYAKQPYLIALYLQQLAAHEVAHFASQEHDVTFSKRREQLGKDSYACLPALELAVISALKLPATPVLSGSKSRRPEDVANSPEGVRLRAELAQKIAEVERLRQEVHAEAERTIEARRALATANAALDAWESGFGKVVDQLEALFSLAAYREWIQGPGSAALPPGLSAQALLAALDRDTTPALLDQIAALGAGFGKLTEDGRQKIIQEHERNRRGPVYVR